MGLPDALLQQFDLLWEQRVEADLNNLPALFGAGKGEIRQTRYPGEFHSGATCAPGLLFCNVGFALDG
jgi:hypothetical protein